MDQAGAKSTNVVSIVGSFGIKSTRSASAYLTLRPGSEAGAALCLYQEGTLMPICR